MKAQRKRPCGSCPYRKDVPPGVWHPSEYEKLPTFDLPTAEQPPKLFGCHQDDGHLCAGWVGTHDMTQTLGLRIGVSLGHIDPDEIDKILDYECPVPLFESGTAAAAHGLSEIENPSPAAMKIMQKMFKKGKKASDE